MQGSKHLDHSCKRAVWKVRGLTLLRVRTSWRCNDGLFFEVPPLPSDALLTTLHPLLENVLQTQKSHGARSDLNSVFGLEKVDQWNPIRTSAIQSRSRPMRFLGISIHEKEAPKQEVSKWSAVYSTFWRSGWSVVRSESLAKWGTSKKRPSPHLHKVPTRDSNVSPVTFQTTFVTLPLKPSVCNYKRKVSWITCNKYKCGIVKRPYPSVPLKRRYRNPPVTIQSLMNLPPSAVVCYTRLSVPAECEVSYNGWSVVRSASLIKEGTWKRRRSPHLHKVPTRSNKVTLRTLQTALVCVCVYIYICR
jgi:hypothetical protein